METLKKIKPHLPYILGLALIIIIAFFPYFINLNKTVIYDKVTYYFPRATLLKQSWERFHDIMPLWSPYWMSGTPFFGKPGGTYSLNYFSGFLFILIPNTIAALQLNYLIDVFLAALFMYIFMIYLYKKPKIAFISAILFIFNGYFLNAFGNGWLTSLNAYPLMPLVMLFTMKAFKEKEWLRYSIITGIIFGLMIHGGSDLKVFLWTTVMFGGYLVFSLIGKNLPKRVIKIVLIAIVVGLVCFGLTAIKTLPTKDYMDLTARGRLSFSEATGRKVSIGNLFHYTIQPIKEGFKLKQGNKGIGILPFLLVGFAIFKKWKNKNVIFFTIIALLSLSLVNGSFVYYLFWKLPLFSGQRHIERTLILFMFSCSVLAGLGASILINRLKERFKLSETRERIVWFSLTALILINLIVINNYTYNWKNPRDVYEIIENNDILQDLSKKPGIFRIHVYETRGIDWPVEWVSVPLGIQNIFGYEGAWLPDYLNVYLSVANSQPAKFWGMLNTKYITLRKKMNISGFRFVKKYENCSICFPENERAQKVWGPYLYENELFLPRAYFVDNSVLVVGEKDAALQTIYGLMMDDRFHPYNTVIILGKEKINDYNIKHLKRFSVIFLTKDSVDQNSGYLLKQYVDSGGILLPNIVEGKNSLSGEDIDKMWNLLEGNITPVKDSDIITHNFDKYELKLHNKKDGFLVLSERFSLFPGWTAMVNDSQKEIFRADGVLTSIYLESPVEKVIFEFKPKSYLIGSIITFTTIVLILGYFIFRAFKKRAIKRNSGTATVLQN